MTELYNLTVFTNIGSSDYRIAVDAARVLLTAFAEGKNTVVWFGHRGGSDFVKVSTIVRIVADPELIEAMEKLEE